MTSVGAKKVIAVDVNGTHTESCVVQVKWSCDLETSRSWPKTFEA